MLGLIKIAGLSAVLSAGVVTAYEAPVLAGAGAAKLYTDRIAPEPVALVRFAEVQTASVGSDARPSCQSQTWPYLSAECAGDTGGRKAVRTITIEKRDALNISTLVRVPVPASR